MADRYQDRPFSADDDFDRGADAYAQPAKAESDPLAELARLIGQTDPFAMGRANQPMQPRGPERASYQPPAPAEEVAPAGPPPWMRRANPQPAPPVLPEEDDTLDYPSSVHPLHRLATPVAAPEPDYHQPQYAAADHEPDPSRSTASPTARRPTSTTPLMPMTPTPIRTAMTRLPNSPPASAAAAW